MNGCGSAGHGDTFLLVWKDMTTASALHIWAGSRFLAEFKVQDVWNFVYALSEYLRYTLKRLSITLYVSMSPELELQ